MRFVTLLVCLLLGVARTPPGIGAEARTPDPIGRALADVLAEVDAGPGATRVLYDRVLPLSGIERFDGSAGAPAAGAATWRQLHDELWRATPASARGLDPETLDERARAAGRAGVVPLAVLDAGYERIHPEALARGMLRVRDGRLTAGEGDPFVPGRVFAAAALRPRTCRGADVLFSLDPERYVTDRAAPPRTIEVDFADGGGFRRVALGERCPVRYRTAGPRSLRVRVTQADGTVQHAAAAFTVAALQAPVPDDTLLVTATTPYLGVYGSGTAYVLLAPGHTVLTNPVVVPEGFDLDNDMGWEELYALLDQQGLTDSLRARGFDAVVLDFADATDYIQRNAFVVAELIGQVEAAIAPQATLAVVGPSMGGLCSRYALAWLEAQGPGHRVRTWISFDSPHAGADIPLGIQYWMKFYAGQSADAAHLLDRLDRPAARQMLVHHWTDPPGATGVPDPLRGALLSDFGALGDWPAAPRRVAVANGSGESADQGFLPGAQLVQYHYTSLLVTLVGDVWAVPDQVSGTIFDGRIRILLSDNRQTVTVAGTEPYDGAPGGWRASMAQMDSSQAPYGDIVALHPHHCFIPSVSALALESVGLFHDIAGDPDVLTRTPFDAIYHPAENQEHVTITAQSVAWFLDEIGRGVVAVPPAGPAPEAALALRAAGPNPFRSATRLGFTLPAPGPADLRVYDPAGREVAVLARGTLAQGAHEVVWRGLDASGRAVPPGLYFVRLAAHGSSAVRRVVRLE